MKDAAEKTKKIAKQLSNLFTAPSRQAVQYQNEPSTKETSGFFDIRFTRFITNTLISIVWAITVTITILVSLFCIGIALYSVSQGEATQEILAAAFVVPIAGVLFLLVVRMWLEFIIIVFRIETNTRNLKEIKEILEKDSEV